jgi:NADH-quinone oxidoreductase subunit L
MAWPLRVLALCALAVGFVVGPATHWFAEYLHHTPGLAEVPHPELNVPLMILSGAAALIGVVAAWALYVRSPALPSRISAAIGPLYKASLNKLYFDEIFWALFVGPLRLLAWVAAWFDRRVIDPLVDVVGLVPRFLSGVPRVFHHGLVPTYALVMWIGVVVCAVFALRWLP